MTTLVVGDTNADLSATAPHLPFEGDDCQFEGLSWGSGGSAANVAVALALLGQPTRLLTRVGNDPAAVIALRAAQAAGVDLSAVQSDPTLASGLCLAVITPNGERTFFSYRGANQVLDRAAALAALDGANWLHLSAYALLGGAQRGAACSLIELATARDIPVSLDLCLPLLRQAHGLVLELLPRLRVLFANEPELAELAPTHAAEAALDWLLACGVQTVAIKLGPRGCLAADHGERVHQAAFVVEAIDTNGCGDAFVAGFLAARQHGERLANCAQLGNAMGALAATRRGAAEALPTHSEVLALISSGAS